MVEYHPIVDRTVAGMHHLDRGKRQFPLYQPLSEFPVVYSPATVTTLPIQLNKEISICLFQRI